LFYKPQSLNDIAGNKIALQNLGAILLKKELAPRAYIIDGPSGVGKTTVAKIFLSHFGEVAVIRPDELDIADIPECLILENIADINHSTTEQIAKLIDSDKHFVVITTQNYYRLPQTLKTRAYRIQLGLLNEESLRGLICKVAQEKSIHYDLNGLYQLCIRAEGNPGKVLTLLHGASLTAMRGEINGSVRFEPLELDNRIKELFSLSLPEAIKLVRTIEASADDIVDQLFTSYSLMYFNNAIPQHLSNYKNVTSIFLKWKGARDLPSESLPLLLKELANSEEATDMKFHEISMVKEPVNPRCVIVQPRELGPSELSGMLGAEIIGEV